MTPKPTTADGYSPELAEAARRMCLYVATILGDLQDDVVVVGGLVPYLIVDQTRLTAAQRHVGTRDLDLGLSIAILDDRRYQEIAERLRQRGFRQAANERGNLTRQTWRLEPGLITLDFLIAPLSPGQRPGSLQNLEPDFAAIVMPALPLAFLDVLPVTIDDLTPTGERARREVRVAGPAAFVTMKAHAFRIRGANKDAYDLVYVLLYHGAEPITEVALAFRKLAAQPEAQAALRFLEEDFASADHLGPKRHAEFLGARDNIDLRQDAFGVVQAFLHRVRSQG